MRAGARRSSRTRELHGIDDPWLVRRFSSDVWCWCRPVLGAISGGVIVDRYRGTAWRRRWLSTRGAGGGRVRAFRGDITSDGGPRGSRLSSGGIERARPCHLAAILGPLTGPQNWPDCGTTQGEYATCRDDDYQRGSAPEGSRRPPIRSNSADQQAAARRRPGDHGCHSSRRRKRRHPPLVGQLSGL